MQIQGTREIGSTKRKFHLSGVPLTESRLYIFTANSFWMRPTLSCSIKQVAEYTIINCKFVSLNFGLCSCFLYKTTSRSADVVYSGNLYWYLVINFTSLYICTYKPVIDDICFFAKLGYLRKYINFFENNNFLLCIYFHIRL